MSIFTTGTFALISLVISVLLSLFLYKLGKAHQLKIKKLSIVYNYRPIAVTASSFAKLFIDVENIQKEVGSLSVCRVVILNNSIKAVKNNDIYTGTTKNKKLVLSVPDGVIIDYVKVEKDLSTIELNDPEVVDNKIHISFDNMKANEYITLFVLYETSELGWRATPQDNHQQDNMLVIARSPKFYSESIVDDIPLTNISEYVLRPDNSSPIMSSFALAMFAIMTLILLFSTANLYYIKFTTNEPVDYLALILQPLVVLGMLVALRHFYNKFTKGIAQIPKNLRKALLQEYNVS